MRWRESDGIRWLESDLPGAKAAFTTRGGGVSEGPFATLNLGRLTGDDSDAVRENRIRAARAVGVDPSSVLIGRQIHGARIGVHDRPTEPNAFTDPTPGLPEADGHATVVPGLAPLVFVADCLPVALAGAQGVAMIHCGWRGLSAGIVENGVRAVEATNASVGPGIGPCCYEVGEEVLAQFESLGAGISRSGMLDLREIARRLLERAGVRSIEVSELCTSCEPELFFSHRRDAGRTGRQAGLAWIEGEAS